MGLSRELHTCCFSHPTMFYFKLWLDVFLLCSMCGSIIFAYKWPHCWIISFFLFTHQQSENMFNKHDTCARYSELINTLFFYQKVMFNLLVIGNWNEFKLPPKHQLVFESPCWGSTWFCCSQHTLNRWTFQRWFVKSFVLAPSSERVSAWLQGVQSLNINQAFEMHSYCE